MVLDGIGSVYDNTGWYLVSIKLVLLDIRWYRVSKGLVCLIYWKKSIFGQVSPMPDRQTTEYRATQLVYSIKFKLSHAMSFNRP